MKLKWDYDKRRCTFGLPGYVKKALKKLKYVPSNKKLHTPKHPYPITYGKKLQSTEEYMSGLATEAERKKLESIVRTFLYYSRIVDSTIRPALNDLSIKHTKATTKSIQDSNQLIDYLHTNLNTTKIFHKSDMILNIHSNTPYLSVSKGRSRAARHFYLGDTVLPEEEEPYQTSIDEECLVIKPVIGLASEAEMATVLVNT